jgi:hypothetical protein
MSDLKSKMPDLNEMTTMATKFLKDMKNSVGEIVEMYKQKRSESCSSEACTKESAPKGADSSKEEEEKK